MNFIVPTIKRLIVPILHSFPVTNAIFSSTKPQPRVRTYDKVQSMLGPINSLSPLLKFLTHPNPSFRFGVRDKAAFSRSPGDFTLHSSYLAHWRRELPIKPTFLFVFFCSLFFSGLFLRVFLQRHGTVRLKFKITYYRLCPVCGSWLIDDRTIAKKVKNTAPLSAHEIRACGATRECPNCHYRIDNSDVLYEWPGLPAGVKFNPSDIELLEHLAAKCGVGDIKPHKLIDEFIPTLEGDEGICYTHPKKLPGAKKDGGSVYFFHRTFNAYATGQRKRRRVHSESSSSKEHVRWHKTGKTKLVMENGILNGWKKIMVLYKGAKMSKPDKSNWVVHQYHLGPEEDERGGEYVVSKIFHQQPKQSDKNDGGPVIEVHDSLALQTSPRTPNPNPPNPPRPGIHDNVVDDNAPLSAVQEGDSTIGAFHVPPLSVGLEDGIAYPTCLAGESQAVETDDLNFIDDSWRCKEILYSTSHLNNPGLNHASYSAFSHNTNVVTGTDNTSAGFFDLENLELDTPPDFQLDDLNFDSQDSAFGWLDRL